MELLLNKGYNENILLRQQINDIKLYIDKLYVELTLRIFLEHLTLNFINRKEEMGRKLSAVENDLTIEKENTSVLKKQLKQQTENLQSTIKLMQLQNAQDRFISERTKH